MIIIFDIPTDFSFKRTAISHGWYDLVPFSLDRESWTLRRVLDLRGKPIEVKVSSSARTLQIEAAGKPSKRDEAKIVRDVRHMLRLDDDLSEFYERVAADSRFSWIASCFAGRLLRAPTVYEDAVKMICTTNCSWSLTDKMITSLVEALGRPASNGVRTFPGAEVMSEQPERFYKDVMRSGYRAPYIREFAQRVASGEIDPESWLTSELPTPDLKKEMKKVKGIGDYAAENLLKLVGRYDGLALDSWVRGQFAKNRNNGRKASDKKIEKFYSGFGKWKGLAVWCDMTRDWLEDEQGTW